MPNRVTRVLAAVFTAGVILVPEVGSYAHAAPPQGFGVVIRIPKGSRVKGNSALGPVHVHVAGPADGIVTGPTNQTVSFLRMFLSCEDEVIGRLTIELDPRFSSMGSLSTTTFPTLHTQDFHVTISAENLGPDPLVSNTAIQMQAMIDAIPPTGATYRKIGPPIEFYVVGDPNQETILTITDVETLIGPPIGLIPTLSEWGMLTLVLVLFSIGLLLLRRRSVVRSS